MPELYKQISKTAKKGTEVSLFPDKTDDETLGWLYDRLSEMDSGRDDKNWELRHEQEDAKIYWNEDGTANVNLPLERSQARLKEADETAQKSIITFKPTEPDDVDKVEVTEEIWDFAWTEANTEEELSKARKCKRIFGTAVWKEYLATDRIMHWQLEKEKNTGKLKGTHKLVERSWLQGEMIDIRNFWIDPVHNQDDAVDCFEAEVDISKEELESLKKDPNYKNIDKALDIQPLDNEWRKREFFTNEEKRTAVPLNNPKYTLYHYYNKNKGVYIVSVNLKVIIREGVNPCPTGGLPYVILTDEPKYMSLYGRGLHEQLETAKYEMNVTTNQIIDLIRESSTNTLLLGENAGVEDAQIVNGVGRILNISGSDNFQWSTPPQSDKGLFNLRQLLQTDATMTTGIDAYSVMGDTAKTLGQEEIREVNRLKAFAESIRAYNYFLVRMARLRLAFIKFYLPVTTGKKITGNQKWRKIPIENKKIKAIKKLNKNGELEEKGLKFEDKEGYTDFLEATPDVIMSNLDVTVETPITSSTLKTIRKLRLQEIFDSVIKFAQIDPTVIEKYGKFIESSLENLVELAGGDVKDFFAEADVESEKSDLRQKLLGDLPLPPKAQRQPEPRQADTLAQAAGANVEQEAALEEI